MRQILTLAFLNFVCCFAISAQSGESACQKLELEAPETIEKNGRFEVALNLEKSKQFENAPIRWKIIKGSQVTEINMENMIPVDAYNVEEGDFVIVLAETIGDKCRNFAMAKIFVQVGCKLPYTVDEYGKLSWNDEKARLDNAAFQFEQLTSPKDLQNFKLVVFLEFDKKVSKNTIKNRIGKILNYLSGVRLINKKRIAFIISESDSELVRYQFLPPDYPYSIFDNALIINGDDFAKLESLFQTKIPNSKK